MNYPASSANPDGANKFIYKITIDAASENYIAETYTIQAYSCPMVAPFADGSVFEFWLGTIATPGPSTEITFENAFNGPSCGFTSDLHGEFISIFSKTIDSSSQVTQLSINLVDIRYAKTYSV